MKPTLIAGWQPHDHNVFRELNILLRVDELHHLVIDDAGVGIVDSTVTTDQKLRGVIVVIWSVLGKEVTESRI